MPQIDETYGDSPFMSNPSGRAMTRMPTLELEDEDTDLEYSTPNTKLPFDDDSDIRAALSSTIKSFPDLTTPIKETVIEPLSARAAANQPLAPTATHSDVDTPTSSADRRTNEVSENTAPSSIYQQPIHHEATPTTTPIKSSKGKPTAGAGGGSNGQISKAAEDDSQDACAVVAESTHDGDQKQLYSAQTSVRFVDKPTSDHQPLAEVSGRVVPESVSLGAICQTRSDQNTEYARATVADEQINDTLAKGHVGLSPTNTEISAASCTTQSLPKLHSADIPSTQAAYEGRVSKNDNLSTPVETDHTQDNRDLQNPQPKDSTAPTAPSEADSGEVTRINEPIASSDTVRTDPGQSEGTVRPIASKPVVEAQKQNINIETAETTAVSHDDPSEKNSSTAHKYDEYDKSDQDESRPKSDVTCNTPPQTTMTATHNITPTSTDTTPVRIVPKHKTARTSPNPVTQQEAVVAFYTLDDDVDHTSSTVTAAGLVQKTDNEPLDTVTKQIPATSNLTAAVDAVIDITQASGKNVADSIIGITNTPAHKNIVTHKRSSASSTGSHTAPAPWPAPPSRDQSSSNVVKNSSQSSSSKINASLPSQSEAMKRVSVSSQRSHTSQQAPSSAIAGTNTTHTDTHSTIGARRRASDMNTPTDTHTEARRRGSHQDTSSFSTDTHDDPSFEKRPRRATKSRLETSADAHSNTIDENRISVHVSPGTFEHVGDPNTRPPPWEKMRPSSMLSMNSLMTPNVEDVVRQQLKENGGDGSAVVYDSHTDGTISAHSKASKTDPDLPELELWMMTVMKGDWFLKPGAFGRKQKRFIIANPFNRTITWAKQRGDVSKKCTARMAEVQQVRMIDVCGKDYVLKIETNRHPLILITQHKHVALTWAQALLAMTKGEFAPKVGMKISQESNDLLRTPHNDD